MNRKATSCYNFVSLQAKRTGRFIKIQIIDRVMIPIRWLGRTIKKAYNFFVQKVAIPLYESIARYLVAIWKILVSLWKFTLKSLLAFYNFFTGLLKQGVKMMVLLAKNISKFYSKILENSLIFALSFGMIGELIFTILAIGVMISPSLACYYWNRERWFVIMSSILTMAMIATGYKHLSRIKDARVRSQRQK